MTDERLTIEDVRLVWEDLTCMTLDDDLAALFRSRPEAEALAHYSERVLRRTGAWAMDRHPNGDLKLRDWIRATEVSPERAAEVRASAEAVTRRQRAREARRREREWAGYERSTSHEFGPTWRFPTPGGIAKKDMG